MIGHTLGYDLAVLKRECDRANVPFPMPRTLDTRLLAQVVEPNLAELHLESLAAWLGIAIADRHSALGDALTTARIFTALVPEAARRRHPHTRRGNAGLPRPDRRARQAAPRRLGRSGCGTIAGRRRAGTGADRQLSVPPPHPRRHALTAVIVAGTAAADALSRLMEERISSLYVQPAAGRNGNPSWLHRPASSPSATSTRHRRPRCAALTMPVEQIMTTPLAAVPAGAFVYRAIGRMSRLEGSPSRRGRRGRTRHRSAVGARSAAAARRRSRDARRRDRPGR